MALAFSSLLIYCVLAQALHADAINDNALACVTTRLNAYPPTFLPLLDDFLDALSSRLNQTVQVARFNETSQVYAPVRGKEPVLVTVENVNQYDWLIITDVVLIIEGDCTDNWFKRQCVDLTLDANMAFWKAKKKNEPPSTVPPHPEPMIPGYAYVYGGYMGPIRRPRTREATGEEETINQNRVQNEINESSVRMSDLPDS